MSTLLEDVRLDAQGLVPVVAQDARDGRVLMLAYANADALRATHATGFAHYWSRSRRALWKKGESSGHLQRVVEVRLDCDGDTVLYRVLQAGPACHTGASECFFRVADAEGALLDAALPPARDRILRAVFDVVCERARTGDARSYTRKLLDGGAGPIGDKLREEADEAARALASEPDEYLAREVADLWFHSLVALASRGVSPDRVFDVLAQRFGVSGLDEKASRPPKA